MTKVSSERLSPETMRSINFTLRLQVRYYLRSYEEGVGKAYKLRDIVDDIHFYWFRNSLVREYKWTKDLKTINYIENNSSEMKVKIKEIAVTELSKIRKGKNNEVLYPRSFTGRRICPSRLDSIKRTERSKAHYQKNVVE